MKINLSEINEKEFKVSRRAETELGNVVLINPGFDKGKWEQNQLHLRSLLCDEHGNVLSAGWPKFHNYGEIPEKDLLVEKAIVNGLAWHSDKLDGSLIIRTVINGEVHFRTRGSHQLGDFEPEVMAIVREKYPKLLVVDNAVDSSISYLFEYTSPNNKIILDYSEPELTLLGAVTWKNGTLEYTNWSEEDIRKDSEYFGVPAVKFYKLSNKLTELLDEVSRWTNLEGIVVRCLLDDNKIHFVKIKAAEYIRLHSLRFHFSNEKVKLFVWSKNIRNLPQLQKELLLLGLDWEVISFIQPVFEEYANARLSLEDSVFKFIKKIQNEKVAELPDRKQKALRLKELIGDELELFSVGIQYVTGNVDFVNKFIAAKSLGVSVNHIDTFKRAADDFVLSVSNKANKSGDLNG